MLTKVLIKTAGWGIWHPDDVHIEVVIPPGYRRVFTGAVKPHDLHVVATKLCHTQEVAWRSIETPPRYPDHYSRADAYLLLIREGAELVDKLCEKCQAFSTNTKDRFCSRCKAYILQEVRYGLQ